MEESIGKLCATMARFCNHIESSCSALKESVERRPIPLDSASTIFVQTVNQRVSAVVEDLNMLDSMSFATVSFEELLGHCNEVLKTNQSDMFALQDHLRYSFDYIPPLDFDEEDELDGSALEDLSPGSSNLALKSNDYAEQDSLLDDSLSLRNFGISDVSLANIASQANTEFEMDQPDFLIGVGGDAVNDFNQYENSECLLNISKEDYEGLPKHMKGLASWEDLLVAVEKMNSHMRTKRAMQDTLKQDEIELLELGHKARSYLFLLIKMNRLSVEASQGVISYRVQTTT